MRISDWSSDVCSSDLEDGFWRFSARRLRRGDVVHRHEQATLSESRQKSPFGLPVPPAGQRRRVAAMNHIAASAPPRKRTGLTIIMGQDHPTLVLTHHWPDGPPPEPTRLPRRTNAQRPPGRAQRASLTEEHTSVPQSLIH